MNAKPIGVFDSGIGGLTVVRALHRRLPNENLVYFGDTARVPYGPKSALVVREYAAQDTEFLLGHDVKIVVVANGPGIDFLLDGAKDKNGNPFDAIVQDLVTQGVEFRACRNTLTVRRIDPSKLLPEATLVASGVAEAAQLQAREGYAYIRP